LSQKRGGWGFKKIISGPSQQSINHMYLEGVQNMFYRISFNFLISDQIKGNKEAESKTLATYSRPLRTSFCKALVRMSHHISYDFNTIAPKMKYTDAELRLAIELIKKKTVQVIFYLTRC
jgi:hypothetical protein